MTWNDVELRHLHAFLGVYEHRSFGRAAEALGYSQAAISQQISSLERAIGTPLFERPGGPRPVEPTDAAAELLPRAHGVFRELRAAKEALDDVLDGTRGRLAIGSFESVSVSFLPAVVAGLTSERPDLELELVEEPHDHRPLVEGVATGELDAAFVPEHRPIPGLHVVPLLSDPYVAVLPAGHEGSSIDIDDLARMPLVGHIDADICQVSVNLALRAHGATPRYVFRSSDNGALQAMVRSGLGAAVMPLLAVDMTDPDVAVVPTVPPIQPRQICLVRRADREPSPALARFIEIVDDVAATFRERLAA